MTARRAPLSHPVGSGHPGTAEALALGALLGATTLLYPRTALDSSGFTCVARTILEGGAPYRDAWDIKAPGVYYVYAAGLWMFGKSAVGLRLLDLLWQSATALVIRAVAARVWSDPVAARCAAVLYLLVYYSYPYYAHAQPDGMLSLPLALSWLAALRALRGGSVWAWGAAAAGVAAAIAFKLPFGIVGVALLWAAWRAAPGGWSAVARRWSALAAGLAVPLLALAAYLAARGCLSDFVASQWRAAPAYTAHLRSALTFGCFTRNVLMLSHVPAYALATGSVLWTAAALRRDRTLPVAVRLVWMWAACAALVLVVHGSWLPYHFLPLAAPLAILGAGPCAATLACSPGPRRPPRYALLLAAVLALAPPAEMLRRRIGFSWHAWRHPATVDSFRDIGVYLRDHTAPSDTIFVWGNAPAVYVHAERKASSRFHYVLHLAGSWSLADYRTVFLSEFRARPPRYFVLVKREPPPPCAAATRIDEMDAYETFTPLRRIIDAGYRLERDESGLQLYRRIDGAAPAS